MDLLRSQHDSLYPLGSFKVCPRELHETELSTGLESYRHAASACVPKSAPASVDTDAVLPAARFAGTATELHREKPALDSLLPYLS